LHQRWFIEHYPDFEKKSSSITLLSPTADVGLAAARDRPRFDSIGKHGMGR